MFTGIASPLYLCTDCTKLFFYVINNQINLIKQYNHNLTFSKYLHQS